MNIKEKLVEKSIEAFIMGIEIYNKPTIKYRIEGFSFFICNAWELMLKAELLKREQNIYYHDSKNRTISLENCIKLIFTNNKGGLRRNLETILELRNDITHFITEDYEYIYAPLFQACVLNYVEKLKVFHNKHITDYISQNFLTLSVRLNRLNDEEIRAKYSSDMAEKIIADSSKIQNSISESNSEYAIPIKTEFYITKNLEKADMIIGIDKNSHNKMTPLKILKDPNDIYIHTTKQVIEQVNKKLKSKGIKLQQLKNEENIEVIFNKYHLQLFMDVYQIKNNENFCYYYKVGNRYSYSPAVVEFIVEEILKNPHKIIEDLKKVINKNKITPGT